MNVACPECSTVYRIDPTRVPESGVTTRCRQCSGLFRVASGPEGRPGAIVTAEAVRAAAAAPAAGAGSAERRPPTPVFGPQDPDTRARRLARALVSDIKVYNPERWQQSRDRGTLRKDFRDEVLKSWEEYVEQVGEPLAKRTPYFRDALNDILAEGRGVF